MAKIIVVGDVSLPLYIGKTGVVSNDIKSSIATLDRNGHTVTPLARLKLDGNKVAAVYPVSVQYKTYQRLMDRVTNPNSHNRYMIGAVSMSWELPYGTLTTDDYTVIMRDVQERETICTVDRYDVLIDMLAGVAGRDEFLESFRRQAEEMRLQYLPVLEAYEAEQERIRASREMSFDSFVGLLERDGLRPFVKGDELAEAHRLICEYHAPELDSMTVFSVDTDLRAGRPVVVARMKLNNRTFNLYLPLGEPQDCSLPQVYMPSIVHQEKSTGSYESNDGRGTREDVMRWVDLQGSIQVTGKLRPVITKGLPEYLRRQFDGLLF